MDGLLNFYLYTQIRSLLKLWVCGRPFTFAGICKEAGSGSYFLKQCADICGFPPEYTGLCVSPSQTPLDTSSSGSDHSSGKHGGGFVERRC